MTITATTRDQGVGAVQRCIGSIHFNCGLSGNFSLFWRWPLPSAVRCYVRRTTRVLRLFGHKALFVACLDLVWPAAGYEVRK